MRKITEANVWSVRSTDLVKHCNRNRSSNACREMFYNLMLRHQNLIYNSASGVYGKLPALAMQPSSANHRLGKFRNFLEPPSSSHPLFDRWQSWTPLDGARERLNQPRIGETSAGKDYNYRAVVQIWMERGAGTPRLRRGRITTPIKSDLDSDVPNMGTSQQNNLKSPLVTVDSRLFCNDKIFF